MADQVSSLSIQISSDASKATAAIDTLISKLNGLNTALGSVNGSGLSTLASGITQLSSAIVGFKAAGASKGTFSTVASGLKALEAVDASRLNQSAAAIHQFSTSINGVTINATVAKSFSDVARALRAFGSADITTARANINSFVPELNRLATAINNLRIDPDKIKYVRDLANAVSRLGSKNVTNAANGLGTLGNQLNTFFGTIGNLPAVNQSVIDFTDACGNFGTGVGSLLQGINGLGGATLGLSGFLGGVARLAVGIAQVATGAGSLAGALNIAAGSMKIIQTVVGALTSAMSKFASVMWKAITAVGEFAKNHLPLLGRSAQSVQPHIQSLGFALWKLYAQLLLLRRILQVLSKPIEIASSLTEIQNVVNHTFGDMQYKLKDFTRDSIEQYGLSELSAKRFASRFQAMGVAMGITGGQVSAAGDNIKRLGRDIEGSHNSMADMSIELTKLTGDLASFFDEDQAVVAEKLNSVFTGMARPLRAYGIDLTQATLQEWALKHGIDANVASMNQAEKTMLRYQYVMANTQHAAGDFARTADTWANQIRQLKQNFEALGATMGGAIINALKPIVTALNSAIKAVTGFAKVISDALGFIFGWKYEEGGGGIGSVEDEFEGAADAAGDMEKGTGGAADNAKKLKSYLLGIDELNVLEPDDEKGSGGGGGGGGGAGGAASAADADGGHWEKANSALMDYISNIGSLFALGRYISSALSRAMESIDWKSIYEKARNFGTGLAQFLNGLITPRLFGNVGRTIANALNTALNFIDAFGETFNWANFGNSLATGFSAFCQNIDWKVAFSAAHNIAVGLAEAINNFITPELFADIGVTLGRALNLAIVALRDFGATIDFSQLGLSVATGISSMLSTINWSSVYFTMSEWGKGLADFLNSLITPEVFGNIGTTLGNVLNSVFRFLDSFGTNFDWNNFGLSIATGIENFFKTFNPTMAGESLNGIITGILDALKVAIDNTNWEEVGNKISEFIKALDPGDIAESFGGLFDSAMDAAFETLIQVIQNIDWTRTVSEFVAGMQGAGNTIDWAGIMTSWLFALPGIMLSSLMSTILGALAGLPAWISEQFKALGLEAPAGLFAGISEGLIGIGEWIENNITDPLINFVKNAFGIHSPSTKFKEIGNDIVEGLIQGIKDWLTNIPAAMSEFAGSVLREAQSFFADPIGKLKEIGGNIVGGFNTGVTDNSPTSQAPVSGWASQITTWFSSLNGGTGINSTTFSGYAKDAVGGFNTSMSTESASTQEPIQTWGKKIITWFTGDGAGEDKINKPAFTKFANDIITAFKETITTNYEQTKEPMDTWVKGLIAWFTGESGDDEGFITKATFTKFAETVIEAFKTTIQTKYNETKEPMETWAKSMVKWINFGDETISTDTGLGKKFYDVGDFAMQGLINGLKSRLSELEDVCREIASAMEDAMEDATEEASPSKSWARIGSFLTEGLAVGMQRQMKLATDTATAVANAVDDAYKPFMPSYSSGAYGLPSAGGNIDSEGITNGLTAVITGAMNSSSDTALMQQQNEILTRIANKNTNVYMDGKKTDQLLKQAQRRSGFSFRPQLGNA